MSSAALDIQENRRKIVFAMPDLPKNPSHLEHWNLKDYEQLCRETLENDGFHRVCMTASGTSALEAVALILALQAGDEIIMPSFTYVSTALPFLKQGVRIVFADCDPKTLNIDPAHVETLVTKNTKAIIVMHYGGVACDMDAFERIAKTHDLIIIEDAAHALHASHRGRALGSIGALGILSFDEQKIVSCGQGGALCVNQKLWVQKAEIVTACGTDRAAFDRGEVPEFQWIGEGTKAALARPAAMILHEQLQRIEDIVNRRNIIHDRYSERLRVLQHRGIITLPMIPDYCTTNWHTFYILLKEPSMRTPLLSFLASHNIEAKAHFSALHRSPVAIKHGWNTSLPNAEYISKSIVRLPLHTGIDDADSAYVIDRVMQFFSHR